ncbi:hypothetical protein CaCOL14_002171 [Colletotrichum acutatum]
MLFELPRDVCLSPMTHRRLRLNNAAANNAKSFVIDAAASPTVGTDASTISTLDPAQLDVFRRLFMIFMIRPITVLSFV